MQRLILFILCLIFISTSLVYADGISNYMDYAVPLVPVYGKQVSKTNQKNSIDLGPYMRELQRRINMNWDCPKNYDGPPVVLIFTISGDGLLLSSSVYKSSGNQNFDKSDMDAIRLSDPFRPFPGEFTGKTIDFQMSLSPGVISVFVKE